MTSNATYQEQVKAAWAECDVISFSHAEAAEADAGFDAGEWSGPEHGRMLERALDQCAQRHGFPDFKHLESEAIRQGLYNPDAAPWECADDAHQWEEQSGEPATDVCISCGARRQ